MSAMRPDIKAGPILLSFKPLSKPESTFATGLESLADFSWENPGGGPMIENDKQEKTKSASFRYTAEPQKKQGRNTR